MSSTKVYFLAKHMLKTQQTNDFSSHEIVKLCFECLVIAVERNHIDNLNGSQPKRFLFFLAHFDFLF